MPFLYNGDVGRPTEKHARGYSVRGGIAVERVKHMPLNLGLKSISRFCKMLGFL